MVTTRLVKNPEDTQPTAASEFNAGFDIYSDCASGFVFDIHLACSVPVRSDFKLVNDVTGANATSSDVTPRGAGVCLE